MTPPTTQSPAPSPEGGKTPETDAVVEHEGEYTAIRQIVSADFARRLERERDEARRERDWLKKDRGEVMQYLNDAAREAHFDGYDSSMELWRNFSSHLDRYKHIAEEAVSALRQQLEQAQADKAVLRRYLTDNPNSLGAQIESLRTKLAQVEAERDARVAEVENLKGVLVETTTHLLETQKRSRENEAYLRTQLSLLRSQSQADTEMLDWLEAKTDGVLEYVKGWRVEAIGAPIPPYGKTLRQAITAAQLAAKESRPS